ncbi:hypothetical protein [Enterococcus termitis]|uniref:Uncharacterized protein n=1 Tax=Enterococcus termitis TaxID=332950 RepID=A0A1E5GAX6_9ENTE|nr:hypothetical protein [Enterococcus termitis]OEG09862.1 hypothetical protein BCR25_10180 [Enterococcus termitis]OJG98367.1 hypothetical protein RV18_GL003268 [Enterococcus termitis]
MRKKFYKIIISIGLIYVGVLISGVQVNAASFDSMKDNVLNGEGKLIHPNLYREMTEEEKEDFKDDPGAPTQINRAMTEKEVNEYIRYVEKYQEANNTSEVPYEAYDYIQFIAEELEDDQTLEITDDLRAKAEKFAEKQSEQQAIQDSDVRNEQIKSVGLLFRSVMGIQWFD